MIGTFYPPHLPHMSHSCPLGLRRLILEYNQNHMHLQPKKKKKNQTTCLSTREIITVEYFYAQIIIYANLIYVVFVLNAHISTS